MESLLCDPEQTAFSYQFFPLLNLHDLKCIWNFELCQTLEGDVRTKLCPMIQFTKYVPIFFISQLWYKQLTARFSSQREFVCEYQVTTRNKEALHWWNNNVSASWPAVPGSQPLRTVAMAHYLCWKFFIFSSDSEIVWFLNLEHGIGIA